MAGNGTLSQRPSFVFDGAIHTNGGTIDWDSIPSAAPYLNTAGEKFVPAGTVVHTYTSGAKKGQLVPSTLAIAGPIANTAMVGLLIGNAYQPGTEAAKAHAASGNGVYNGGTFVENLLPEASTGGTLPSAIRTPLVALATIKFTTYSSAV